MKKHRSLRSGMTVIEVLIAVGILAIFVSMAAVGTTALFGTGEQMMAVSKAAVLGADAMDIVRNEIGYGENCTGTGNALSYNSASYGDGCVLKVEEGRLIVVRMETVKDPSNLDTTKETVYETLGTAAYGEVSIGEIAFTTASTGAISVKLSVCGTNGKTLWSNETTILPLYLKLTA